MMAIEKIEGPVAELLSELASVIEKHDGSVCRPDALAVLGELTGQLIAMLNPAELSTKDALVVISKNIDLGIAAQIKAAGDRGRSALH